MSESALPRQVRIYVAGHRGMVGSAIVQALQAQGYANLLLRSHVELDLTDQAGVRRFFAGEKPEYVFLAAAKVGGILANDTYRAEFIRQNLAIQTNVIHEAWRADVKRLLFLGSSCIYPRRAPQPIKEEHLLTGPLEPTNQPYSVAKIAGLEMCDAYNRQYGCDFRAVMPTNLYGPGDNFDLRDSHVIPALIRKFHEARQAGAPSVTVWGSGKPRREFLHVDDLVDACLHVIGLDRSTWTAATPLNFVNVGCGEDLTIAELAATVASVTGYRGRIEFDLSKPDGAPRKLLEVSAMKRLGWRARIGLRDGLEATYQHFQQHIGRQASSRPHR